MSKRLVPFLSLFLLVLPMLLAQQKAQDEDTMPPYDFQTEVTIKGAVEKVSDYQCPASGGMGAHFTLKTADKVIEVHLALSRFLPEYGIKFASGDQVEVVGSMVEYKGSKTLLARTVARGNDFFVFRDQKGRPLW